MIAVDQELRKVKELWNELLNISHVGFTCRPPSIWNTVEQAVCEVKVTTLCVGIN